MMTPEAMPTKRLPWFRMWIDSTSSGKVRQLEDGEFRTWVELLDAAAQQPKRGRFKSRKEACAITRRPLEHVDILIVATLIDEDSDGSICMHDWDEWQRWRPTEEDPDPGAGLHNDQHTINYGSTTDDHGMASGSTHEEHANDSGSTHDHPPQIQSKSKRETKNPAVLRTAGQESDGLGVTSITVLPRKPTRGGLVIDEIRALGVEPSLSARDFAALRTVSPFDPKLIAELYVAIDQHRYGDDWQLKHLAVHRVIEWLPGYLSSKRAPVAANRNGTITPVRQIIDRTGVAI